VQEFIVCLLKKTFISNRFIIAGPGRKNMDFGSRSAICRRDAGLPALNPTDEKGPALADESAARQ